MAKGIYAGAEKTYQTIALGNKYYEATSKVNEFCNENELYGELRMKIQKDHSFDYYHTSLDQEAIGDIFLIHRNNPNVHEFKINILTICDILYELSFFSIVSTGFFMYSIMITKHCFK